MVGVLIHHDYWAHIGYLGSSCTCIEFLYGELLICLVTIGDFAWTTHCFLHSTWDPVAYNFLQSKPTVFLLATWKTAAEECRDNLIWIKNLMNEESVHWVWMRQLGILDDLRGSVIMFDPVDTQPHPWCKSDVCQSW